MWKVKEFEIFPEKYEILKNFKPVICILWNNSYRLMEDGLEYAQWWSFTLGNGWGCLKDMGNVALGVKFTT